MTRRGKATEFEHDCVMPKFSKDGSKPYPRFKRLISADSIKSTVADLAYAIWDPRDSELVLCVILKGAAYFAVDLSRALDDLTCVHSMLFIEASSYTGTQQADKVEFQSAIPPSKVGGGKRVILVDELFDNGLTMQTVYDHFVRDLHVPPENLATCVCFQKKKDPPSPYRQPDFVGFPDIDPDAWLVGYGLDDDGKRRGLRDLWEKK